jgi:transposase
MGEEKGREATLQVEIVCLDELVPADDRYRRLDEFVDWRFVRELAAPYYAEAVGRPSIDPIVLVKLMLAGALEGVGSMRELLRLAALRLDLRRFLGYGFAERLPAHQTISHAHTQRFVDGALFERLFTRSVAMFRARPARRHAPLSSSLFGLDRNHTPSASSLSVASGRRDRRVGRITEEVAVGHCFGQTASPKLVSAETGRLTDGVSLSHSSADADRPPSDALFVTASGFSLTNSSSTAPRSMSGSR